MFFQVSEILTVPVHDSTFIFIYTSLRPSAILIFPQFYLKNSRSIYRRGARRWRKMYKVNGHIFQVSGTIDRFILFIRPVIHSFVHSLIHTFINIENEINRNLNLEGLVFRSQCFYFYSFPNNPLPWLSCCAHFLSLFPPPPPPSPNCNILLLNNIAYYLIPFYLQGSKFLNIFYWGWGGIHHINFIYQLNNILLFLFGFMCK